MASYEYLDYGSPDGAIFGRTSTEKIGFYGTAPVAQYQDSNLVASTYITLRQSTGAVSTVGLNSEAAMSSLVQNVSSLIAAARAVGLVAG
jgi:small-conductance mechanosensitive channel